MNSTLDIKLERQKCVWTLIAYSHRFLNIDCLLRIKSLTRFVGAYYSDSKTVLEMKQNENVPESAESMETGSQLEEAPAELDGSTMSKASSDLTANGCCCCCCSGCWAGPPVPFGPIAGAVVAPRWPGGRAPPAQ